MITAADNFMLIQEFMKRFPEYNSNDMYITSESYGGHYMPTLAKEIVDQNAAGNYPVLNFKGFAVGNPYTDWYSGTPAEIDTYWGHQLVAKPTYDEYISKCVKSKIPHPKDCAMLEVEMMGQVGDLNPYALDYPICTSDDDTTGSGVGSISQLAEKKKGRAQRTWLYNFLHGRKMHREQATATTAATTTTAAVGTNKSLRGEADTAIATATDDAAPAYQPCEDNYAVAYLNDPAVKQAIHVQHGTLWEECSFKVNYDMADSMVSTAPIYNYLIDGGYKLNILVYSGDDDSVCGTIGTQNWIWELGYQVDRRMWQTYTVSEQTAGYFSQWKDTKMGFLTIHGAGHEVPTYKPEVALDMFTRYLNGEWTSA